MEVAKKGKAGCPPRQTIAGVTTDYKMDVVDEIIKLVSEGISLNNIPNTRPGYFPPTSTMYYWVQRDPAFAARFHEAQAVAAEKMMAELLEIADNSDRDWITVDGKKFPNKELVLRSTLRIKTRQWLASKWNRRYAETTKQEITGKDGGPIQLQNFVDKPPDETREQWLSRVEEERRKRLEVITVNGNGCSPHGNHK